MMVSTFPGLRRLDKSPSMICLHVIRQLVNGYEICGKVSVGETERCEKHQEGEDEKKQD